jgi:hypothetical protein
MQGVSQAERFGEWVHWFSSLTGSAFAPCYEEVLNPFRALRVNPSAGN